jgi:hypothetical protein
MHHATTDPPSGVDWHQLRVDLDAACTRRLLSLRQAAQQIGMPVSGLSSFRHDGKLSADNVARLAAWLYPRNVPWWIASGHRITSEEDK